MFVKLAFSITYNVAYNTQSDNIKYRFKKRTNFFILIKILLAINGPIFLNNGMTYLMNNNYHTVIEFFSNHV